MSENFQRSLLDMCQATGYDPIKDIEGIEGVATMEGSHSTGRPEGYVESLCDWQLAADIPN
jgi:hypothetical protein